jgi:V/A-type H+-transporting ATPase subunit C
MPSYEALIDELKHTKYATLFKDNQKIDLTMEREMERSLYELFTNLSKKGKLNLVTPIGFLHKLEYELRDIFAIIEAKRYGHDAAQTKEFLVRKLS